MQLSRNNRGINSKGMKALRIIAIPLVFLAIAVSAGARGLSEGAAPGSIEGTDLYLARVAYKDVAKGELNGALLIYDELLKRHPHDKFFTERMAFCEKKLEAGESAPAPRDLAQQTKSYDDSEAALPEASEQLAAHP
jgi:hypothetical protein